PLISLGGDGAVLYDGENFYKMKIPAIKVKNTVGSGDSTIAGIAVGLSRNMPVCEAVKLGMAAGMANTQFEQTGIVSCELVEKFYKEIKVEIIQ
ncbi:MAG: PfkB family carbohydrate kinase, partial [Clostridia bacterium]|nr:PfkB family carbohydrate kinase [Clostridia bacterium]